MGQAKQKHGYKQKHGSSKTNTRLHLKNKNMGQGYT